MNLKLDLTHQQMIEKSIVYQENIHKALRLIDSADNRLRGDISSSLARSAGRLLMQVRKALLHGDSFPVTAFAEEFDRILKEEQ
jgi:hypothetical protein